MLSRSDSSGDVGGDPPGNQIFDTERRKVTSSPCEFWQGRRAGADRRKVQSEILAEMIGTTRSRVSYFMNKFRTLGYIRYNGKLEIHNSLLNVVLYDKPDIRTKDANNGPR